MPSEKIIIADSGPLICLARIRRLDLLQMEAERVLVPNEVWQEVTVGKPDAAGAADILRQTWMEIVPAPPAQSAILCSQVDAGEAEAMALCQTLAGGMFLVDDLRARKLASKLGIRRMGTMALLGRAKKHGRIKAVRPLIEDLIRNGIYVSETLISSVLAEVGESD